MKLWLLMNRFESGGLERVQVNLAPTLAVEDLEPWLVAGRFFPGAKALLPAGVRTLELAKHGRASFIPGLISQLHAHQPDIVVTTSNDVACVVLILRALLYPRMKVICTQHLSISGPFGRSRGIRRFKLWMIMRLMAWLLPRADALISVSHAVSNDMREALRLTVPINVIHNPVVLPNFRSRMSESVTWPWMDRDVPTIVFVGRLSPEKRVDLLLSAFERTLKEVSARLLIIGDGPKRNAVQQAISESGLADCIRMIGFHANPLPWIKAADLLVLSSDYEGFGMVLVEAMACGTQTVSTDCPDGPAEVLENGRYGTLVSTDDVGALAEGIISALSGNHIPVEDLIRRANEFSLEAAANAYLEVIRRVSGN